uniref:Uncharacterized protein n=1 Tax=Arundo donax TaxID=35708 RepID=A0A0A9A3Z2_ARUDO
MLPASNSKTFNLSSSI